MGSFIYQKNGQRTRSMLVNISEGGMGITEAYDLRIHDLIDGEITSPLLGKNLKVQCRVIYKSDHFSWGLEFSVLKPEDRTIIAEYASQFSTVLNSDE